ERADRPGPEYEAPRQARRLGEQFPGEQRRHRDAAEVVVGKGWVASVRVDDRLAVRRPVHHALGIAQVPWRQLGVDDYLVGALAQRKAVSVSEAEAPLLLVVAGTVGNPVGPLRDRVKVRLQLVEGHRASDRNRIAHDVQVVLAEIYDTPAIGIRDPGIPDSPLPRDLPIEDRRAGRNLASLERNPLPEQIQCASNPVASDAATD